MSTEHSAPEGAEADLATENPLVFPSPDVRDEYGNGILQGSYGLALRDYVATHVLAGMAQNAGFQGAPWRKLATDAYEAADALLAARAALPHP